MILNIARTNTEIEMRLEQSKEKNILENEIKRRRAVVVKMEKECLDSLK